jgi:cephalosporin-C deacetylase
MSLYTKHRRFVLCLVSAPLLAAFMTAPQRRPSLVITPTKPGAIYELGDKVSWTVALPDGASPGQSSVTYVVKKNNQDVIKTGSFDLASGKAVIEVECAEPAMLYGEIRAQGLPDGPQPRATVFGAVVAPTKLRPVQPRPRDFDAFWKSKIAALEAVPMNPELTPKDSGSPDVEYATIKMDHVNGTHVYGQLAKPKREGKFPAMVIYQWASPPYPLQRSWVTDRAKEGWLVLNIEPHDVLPDAAPAYYRALPAELKNYGAIGIEDRDKCYFLQMYLADYRAVDYISQRPDWDGKTLVVTGTSMGGQQSVVVGGLHPKITHVVVNEPSGCDLNAPEHGRSGGYPSFPANNAKAVATAPYFDAINFASHIRATSLVAMGFVDTIAPPAGIWTAYNQIRGRKEAAPMFDSPHNNTATPAQQRPFTGRSAEWFAALVKGDRIPRNSTQVVR